MVEKPQFVPGHRQEKMGKMRPNRALLIVCLILCGGLPSFLCSEEHGDVTDAIVLLQSQVRTLQRARARDQITIRQLRKKLHEEDNVSDDEYTMSGSLKALEGEQRNLAELEVQLGELKKHLSEMVELKDREVRATEDLGEVRGELDSLRTEVLKLRQEMEKVSSRSEEDAAASLGRARTGEVTSKWMQRTVEELRTEMRELASSVNVSAALLQGQHAEAQWTAARSDRATLRRDFEDLRAGQGRTGAQVNQLVLEVVEVRTAEQKLAQRHQELTTQIKSMQSESANKASADSVGIANERLHHSVREITEEQGSGEMDLGDFKDWQTDNEDELQPVHRTRHNHHHQYQQLKLEISRLQASTTEYHVRQKTFVQDLQVLTSDLQTLSKSVQSLNSNVSSVLQERDVRNKVGSDLTELRERLLELEDKTQEQESVQNTSQTSIKKLHQSTVKLFHALESLEEEYGKTISELRKEVSKCDFNMAQIQSSSKVFRQDLTSIQDSQRTTKKDLATLRGEVQRDHYRLLSVQNEVLNRSLQGCRDRNEDHLRDLKISHLEHESHKLKAKVDEYRNTVDRLHSQLEDKADSAVGNQFNQALADLRKEMESFVHKDFPALSNLTRGVESELEKFVRKLPTDCTMSDVMTPPTLYHSGVYLLRAPESKGKVLEAYCDMETSDGHWTLVQRRQDGTQDFYRDWEEYKHGFGQPEGEFWIGNDHLHALTSAQNFSLRIDMWDTWGHYKFAEYEHFSVGSELDQYPLRISGYSGNASDAMDYHNAMKFSTKDRDNDASSTHCAVYYSSGWWYNHCQYVNVNGRYNVGLTWYDIDAHEWVQLNRVEMKVRPTKWTRR